MNKEHESSLQEIDEIIKGAQTIVVIQAENPDGDSLASSLALETIHGANKKVHLYCPVQIPRHLRFMPGWDRVSDELPNSFDAAIIVDTSSSSLMERVFTSSQLPTLRSRPTIVIDHHAFEIDLPYTTTNYLDTDASATGEAIFAIAEALNWTIDKASSELLLHSIMFDTLGLTTESVTRRTLETVTALVGNGVSLAELNEQRRALMKKSVELVRYKGALLTRINYRLDDQLATIHIPWEEIEEYSDAYNPSVLVLDEMRMTENVKVAIAYKTYPDGKITAKIRANHGYPFAQAIAEHFGGGGHLYAAGFKVRNMSLEQVDKEVLQLSQTLITSGSTDETI